MRIYLEAHEQVTKGQEAETFRLDVTDKSQTEQDAILAKLKEVMAGLTCVFTRHDCYHTEGGRLCEVQEV